MFYVVTTFVDGSGNFVVKTEDPGTGGWSDPMLLPQVGGIDPALFFDDDGQAYLVHNDEPDQPAEWDGHRVIRMHRYDPVTDRTFGEAVVLVDGGTHRHRKPVWIEGPHLYKKDGWYYLMAAEGGTGRNHSEVVFRSERVDGPYEAYPHNPILTQRDIRSEDRSFKVTCTGHADLVETPQGEWFAVFLGCRPYAWENERPEEEYYNTGRETFLHPVEWKDGFPVILPAQEAVPFFVERPGVKIRPGTLTGNFTVRDNFTSVTPGKEWVFIRTPKGKWWNMGSGKLILDALKRSIYEVTNPAFMGRRQQHTAFIAETEVSFSPNDEKEMAGIVCYQDESCNFVFGKTIRNGQTVLLLERAEGIVQETALHPVTPEQESVPFRLKVTADGVSYSFYASFDEGRSWITIDENVDGCNLSTHRAGGFTGAMIGLYASSRHYPLPSLHEAYADDFPVGVAVSMPHLTGQDNLMIRKHFNSLTAENDMKPSQLLKNKGEYDFTHADRIIRFARDNDMKVRGHTLVWHNQTPSWFFENENGEPLGREALYERMEEYMTTVMDHFGETVYCWDVVNEAISDNPDELYREDSPWFRICGKDFIGQAFRTARKINPRIKLFYNDYGLINPEKRDKTFSMLKDLIEAGVPIDGIGIQGHWSIHTADREMIQAAIDLFHSLGLEIQITELDLSVHPPQTENPVTETFLWTPEIEWKQADVYRMIFEVLHDNRDKISGVTFWGLADDRTWLDNHPVKGRKDYPLLFDIHKDPKRAFESIVGFLN